MHPILQRLKENATAAGKRVALAAALGPQDAPRRRLTAWNELRADLRAVLATLGREESDHLVELLAPAEPPPRFDRHVKHFVCVLMAPMHAPVQLLLMNNDGRWRPAGPGRLCAWCVGSSMFSDLGAALNKAAEEYERDPDFYESLLKHHTFDVEPVPVAELAPGQDLGDAAAALAGGMAEVSYPPGGIRPTPASNLSPIETEPDDDAPWKGTTEIDPHRPSRKKKGGPQP